MRYKTIVIDPPWDGPSATWTPSKAGTVQRRYSERHDNHCLIPYQTMNGVQLAALRVPELAAESAQLTAGSSSGLSRLVWGGTCRHQAEFLLWSARPGAKLVSPVKCPKQLQDWPTWLQDGKRLRHSEKPAAAYEFIRGLSEAPRIDLFARQRRPGFRNWGNEVPDLACG